MGGGGNSAVYIDSQENCLKMDYDQMKAAITDRTKAILVVDLEYTL